MILFCFFKKKSMGFKLGFDQIKDQTWLLSDSYQDNYSIYLFKLDLA